MDPIRWREIERICDAALAAPAERRAAVLDDLCAGDADLRREVEALLAQTARTNGFLEAPALDDAANVLAERGGGGAADAAGSDEDQEAVLLPEGTRLGPYELGAPIGAGGMGTVYEARDTRLERTVAIKVLPPGFATDPDRRARFTREAKTIATLNHPHICTLHDTGDAVPTGPGSRASAQAGEPALSESRERRVEGLPRVPVHYLVLERVAGETLAARLERGPLPVPLVCELGAQIGDALAAAHKHGIIHRDLKPANVMLTPGAPGSGGVPHVKLLDFGLAKLTGHGEQAVVTTEGEDPTRTDSLTARGTILGTLPYMAPEQLEGKPADARTDLWALGTVLYEMATGQPAFAGDSAVTLMGNILTTDPPGLSERQPVTPPALDRLVRKCLAKRPDDRWDSAHDVADELRWIRDTDGSGEETTLPSVRVKRVRMVAYASAALVLVTASAAVTWLLARPTQQPLAVQRALIDTRPAEGLLGPWRGERFIGLNRPSRTALALSPDGTTLVFNGVLGERQQLFRRKLDETAATPIDGTEGADCPFFSPDGAWVGYWARDALWKVRLDGGAPIEICAAQETGGASWSSRDTIAFENSPGILLVSATGGAPVAAVQVDQDGKDVYYGLPRFLPDGNTLLFTAFGEDMAPSSASIVAVSLTNGTRTVLVDRAMDARYVPTGHIVFARMGRLEAVPFDPVQMAVTGEAVPLVPDVMQALNSGGGSIETGAAQVAISDSGTLAYVPGGVIPDRRSELVWVSRAGTTVEVIPIPPGPYSAPSLSPDGTRILYARTGLSPSLWCHDLARQVSALIPIRDAYPGTPVWFPDGQRALFSSPPNRRSRLHSVVVDGSAPSASVAGDVPWTAGEVGGSWTPDGRALVFTRWTDQGMALWLLQFGGAQPRRSVLLEPPLTGEERDTRFRMLDWPAVSPDGRWLAYTSNESGVREVYAQRFPGLGGKQKISRNGGFAPVWRGDGRELFYLSNGPAFALMSVDVRLGADATWGLPEALFELSAGLHISTSSVPAYDVSLDGQRFLFVRRDTAPAPPPPSQMHIVFNWFEELKAKVPATGGKR